MIKKMEISEVQSKFSKNLKSHKQTRKYTKIKERLEKDTYETTAKARYKSEMNGLEFQYKKVLFHPEDVEKMKKMTLEEQNAFMLKLKKEGKYKIINEEK